MHPRRQGPVPASPRCQAGLGCGMRGERGSNASHCADLSYVSGREARLAPLLTSTGSTRRSSRRCRRTGVSPFGGLPRTSASPRRRSARGTRACARTTSSRSPASPTRSGSALTRSRWSGFGQPARRSRWPMPSPRWDEAGYVVVTAGQFDILVELVCADRRQLLDVTNRMRELDGVVSTESFFYLELWKQLYDWGPSVRKTEAPGAGALSGHREQPIERREDATGDAGHRRRSPRCGVTKRFDDVVAVDELTLEIDTRQLLCPARPFGLRQDDDATHDRRLRGAHRRADLPRRAGQRPPPPTSATSTPSFSRTHSFRTSRSSRTSPSACIAGGSAGQTSTATSTRSCGSSGWRGWSKREPATFRRPAAARRACPRPREQAHGAPAGRAARRPRPQAPQACSLSSRRSSTTRHHVRPCHA